MHALFMNLNLYFSVLHLDFVWESLCALTHAIICYWDAPKSYIIRIEKVFKDKIVEWNDLIKCLYPIVLSAWKLSSLQNNSCHCCRFTEFTLNSIWWLNCSDLVTLTALWKHILSLLELIDVVCLHINYFNNLFWQFNEKLLFWVILQVSIVLPVFFFPFFFDKYF